MLASVTLFIGENAATDRTQTQLDSIENIIILFHITTPATFTVWITYKGYLQSFVDRKRHLKSFKAIRASSSKVWKWRYTFPWIPVGWPNKGLRFFFFLGDTKGCDASVSIGRQGLHLAGVGTEESLSLQYGYFNLCFTRRGQSA